MEGFLSGFKLAPKPLTGVVLTSESFQAQTKAPIKAVLLKLTSAEGLSTWLGETTRFLAHVGIKFETLVKDEPSKAVITALDLPKRFIFMVEAIGEFDFVISEKSGAVNVTLKISRAIAPTESEAWKASLAPMLKKLDLELQND